MKRAALYIRVSTTAQADEGLSIPAQQKLLKEYAYKNSYSVSDEHIFIDAGESAQTADRPQFQLMISKAKQNTKPFDAVLVHKTDRFARNRLDSAVYKTLLRKECGIEVISITENFGDDPYGVMMEGIMELFAEFYSLNLSVEVTKGMTQAAGSGIVLGRVPFGYDIDPETNKYVINEEQAEVVCFIFQMYVELGYGLDKIHTYMTSKAAESRFGEVIKTQASKAKKKTHLAGRKRALKWSPHTIGYMLKNDAYIGIYRWKPVNEEEKILHNNHPPIISKYIYHEAQELMARRRTRRKGEKHEYMLRGLVKCAYCGRVMVISSTKRKNGTSYRYLRCTNKNQQACCRKNSLPYQGLEALIYNSLIPVFESGNPAGKLNIVIGSRSKAEKSAQKIRLLLEAFSNRFDRQMAAFEAGVINIEQLRIYKAELLQEKSDLQQELTQIEERLESFQTDETELLNRISDITGQLQNGSLSEYDKQRILASIIDKITVDKFNEEIHIYYKKV